MAGLEHNAGLEHRDRLFSEIRSVARTDEGFFVNSCNLGGDMYEMLKYGQTLLIRQNCIYQQLIDKHRLYTNTCLKVRFVLR